MNSSSLDEFAKTIVHPRDGHLKVFVFMEAYLVKAPELKQAISVIPNILG